MTEQQQAATYFCPNCGLKTPFTWRPAAQQAESVEQAAREFARDAPIAWGQQNLDRRAFKAGVRWRDAHPDPAVRAAPEGGHREGIVEVYDWNGQYLGCMGVRQWDALLR